MPAGAFRDQPGLASRAGKISGEKRRANAAKLRVKVASDGMTPADRLRLAADLIESATTDTAPDDRTAA